MSDFNSEAFLEWLDGHEGYLSAEEMVEAWPNFPYDELNGCTGPIVDGEFCYYKRDLRIVAEGKKILD